MESTANSRYNAAFPAELRLGILSHLPPNDLALGGRLSSKDAAQRFSEAHHRTARLSQPLPSHATTDTWCAEGAQAATKQLTFRQKLLLLIHSPASGCEANVEFMLQLMQRQLFPELLRTDHYRGILENMQQQQQQQAQGVLPDIGSTAVASGLAHLLPSLGQRCPGLLDPVRALEAAARHCDMAGLETAWRLLGERVPSWLQRGGTLLSRAQLPYEARAAAMWGRMMVAAAGSRTPDATAKLDWLLEKGRVWGFARLPVHPVEAWGAAAASGDVGRLRWLHQRGYAWGMEALGQVVQHGSLGFVQRLEQEGGFLLPAVGDAYWASEGAVCAAARGTADSAARGTADSAARGTADSAAKLRWLAARGAGLGSAAAIDAAAAAADSNLEAVQLLLEHWRCAAAAESAAEQQPAARGRGRPRGRGRGRAARGRGRGRGRGAAPAAAVAPLPGSPLCIAAASSGDVPTVACLHQAGYPLTTSLFQSAFSKGNLPLVRWLLEAGCPRGELKLVDALNTWPCDTPADSAQLGEAVQLLLDAGWPKLTPDDMHQYTVPACTRHPWTVWRVQPGVGFLNAVMRGGEIGCEATMEALIGSGNYDVYVSGYTDTWYADVARNGDKAMLACLKRLGRSVVGTTQALEQAVKKGAPLPGLRWLAEEGASWYRACLNDLFDGMRAYYPAPREEERYEVEEWLSELLYPQQAGNDGFLLQGWGHQVLWAPDLLRGAA